MIGVDLILNVLITVLCRETGHSIRFKDSRLNVGSSNNFELCALFQLCGARLVDSHAIDHVAHLSFMLEESEEIIPVDVCV